MRPVKTRLRWRCDFCRYSSSSVTGMEVHERRCWKNPNRICDLCGNTGIMEHDGMGDGSGIYEEPCFYCKQFNPSPNEAGGL